MQTLETMATKKQFDVIRRDRNELRRFPDHYAVLDVLHDASGAPDGKDAILSALIAVSQSNGPGRDIAVLLLWMALWPGLDALYRRLSRHFASAPEDLVSEISEKFSAVIHRLNLVRVNRIAATLLRNVERDIRTGLQTRWAEAARREDMPAEDSLAPTEEPPSVFGLPTGADADTAATTISRMLTGLIGDDAGLVVAVVILGEGQREAAGRLGISHDAARKRFQRAIQRLRLLVEFS